MRRSAAALVGLLIASLPAIAADCPTPSVSASVIENAVQFQISGGGQCENSTLELDLTGSTLAQIYDCEGPNCNTTLTRGTTCWSTGTHELSLTLKCGMLEDGKCVRRSSNVVIPFEINTKPEVSVSVSEIGANGIATYSGTYDFPNTSDWDPDDHKIRFELLDSEGKRISDIGFKLFETRSGTFSYPLDLKCKKGGTHTLRAKAYACGSPGQVTSEPGKITEKTTEVKVPSRKPEISVTASAPTPTGLVTISGTYSFPPTAQFRRVQVHVYPEKGEPGLPTLSFETSNSTGTFSRVYQADCGVEGKYKVRARAHNCGSSADDHLPTDDRMGEDFADITFPDASPKATINSLTRVGDRHFAAIGFEFPSTRFSSSRRFNVDLFNDKSNVVAKAITSGESQDLSREILVEFDVPAESLTLRATARSCGTRFAKDEAPTDTTCGCDLDTAGSGQTMTVQPAVAKDQGIPNSCSEQPVKFATGNMRYTETEPLPALATLGISRTYDSNRGAAGFFGNGWWSALDARLTSSSWGGSSTLQFVVIRDEMHNYLGFNRTLSRGYEQTWPRGSHERNHLVYNSAAGTWTLYRGLTQVLTFRASDGRLLQIRDTVKDRTVTIELDASGNPALVRSTTGEAIAMQLDASSGRIVRLEDVSTPSFSWSYEYDALGNLARILAPDGHQWRRFTYANNLMTGAYGPLDQLIETHTYDGRGRATSSMGTHDSILNFEYGLPGRVKGELVTRITYASGRVGMVYSRFIAGRDRTVESIHGCASCGGTDGVYGYDSRGYLAREQDGRGYLTITEHDGSGRVSRILSHYRPANCDPEAGSCRLSPDDIMSAGILPTSASTVVDYEYGDARWWDRPTLITTDSVVEPGRKREERFTYDSVTGVSTFAEGFRMVGRSGGPGRTSLDEHGLRRHRARWIRSRRVAGVVGAAAAARPGQIDRWLANRCRRHDHLRLLPIRRQRPHPRPRTSCRDAQRGGPDHPLRGLRCVRKS